MVNDHDWWGGWMTEEWKEDNPRDNLNLKRRNSGIFWSSKIKRKREREAKAEPKPKRENPEDSDILLRDLFLLLFRKEDISLYISTCEYYF